MFVDAKLYHAELPGSETIRHRWRIDAGPLRILGGDGSYSAKLNIRPDERRLLSELNAFLTVAAWRGAGPVGLQLFLDGKRIPLGALITDSVESDAKWTELRAWADALAAVTTASVGAEPAISIVELCDAFPLLSRFAGFVTSPSICIQYEPGGIEDPTRAAVYYVACDVGEWCFLAVVERNTKTDERHEALRSITFGAPRLLDVIVERGCWRDHRTEIEEAYRAQVERLGQPESLWELGELEAFIERVSHTPNDPAALVAGAGR
jgi:hypothetical protein